MLYATCLADNVITNFKHALSVLVKPSRGLFPASTLAKMQAHSHLHNRSSLTQKTYLSLFLSNPIYASKEVQILLHKMSFIFSLYIEISFLWIHIYFLLHSFTVFLHLDPLLKAPNDSPVVINIRLWGCLWEGQRSLRRLNNWWEANFNLIHHPGCVQCTILPCVSHKNESKHFNSIRTKAYEYMIVCA